jgi:hypothetical protein
VHQDTAQSRHRQRSAPPASGRFAARGAAVGAAPPYCLTCGDPRCPWRCWASAGASAPPGSLPGRRPCCYAAWTAGSTGMVVGGARSGPPARRNAAWRCLTQVRASWAVRRPVGLRSSAGCCSGARAVGVTTVRMGGHCCPPWGCRAPRPALCRRISTPRVGRAASCWRRQPAVRSGARCVPPGRAEATARGQTP